MESIAWQIDRIDGVKRTKLGIEYTTLNGKARHAQANAYASGKYPIGACLQAFFLHWVGNDGQPTGYIAP